MNHAATKLWTKPRLGLAGLVVCVVLIGLFYAEEDWRGKKAWEDCKRDLKVRGVDLDWASYIPAPVPDDENIFAVPEMQRWFKGGNAAAWSDLTRNLSSPTFPGVVIDTNTTRMVVAELTISKPGTPVPAGAVALRWDDPAARTEAARLLDAALGPTGKAPQSPIGAGLMLRRPEDIQAARIFLQCQTAPTEKDLETFLPDSILPVTAGLADRVLKFEPDGNDSYHVTMPVLGRVADYLAWSDGLAPEFAVVRRALLRPASRMAGSYENPNTVPNPNFRPARNFAQMLGTRAECHFLLGQPEEALRDLTIVHDFCRIFEEHKPMTLLSAMVNVAVRGLYASQISDGLRLHGWREPQLAILEDQLKSIDVLPPVKQAFLMEAVATYHAMESVPSAGMVKKSALANLYPRGWGFQHVAGRVRLDFDRLASFDTAGQIISLDKVATADRQAHALDDRSAYTYVASLPAIFLTRACQNTTRAQTQVNQALIACALERYQLAHGEYPENLDALVPQFLDKIPHDVIGGRPPHYRRAADGAFLLYSIGWNGHDNGGVRGKAFPSTPGDWVWPD